MNLTRSSIKIFTAKTTSTFVVFLGITFFARRLGPHQMGVFFLFQALLGLLSIPADLGIREGTMKRLSEGKSSGDVLSSAIFLKIIPLSFLTGTVLFSQHYINGYLGSDLAVYLALALVLNDLSEFSIEVLKGELRVGETALPSLSRKIVYVLLGVVLVFNGFGVLALIYGILAGLLVSLIWAIHRNSITFGRPSLACGHSIFDYSKYAFISSSGGYLYNWLDVAVIGFFLTQSHVGAYEIAWRITGVVMILSTAIAMSVFPQISQWAVEDATERIESVIAKAILPSLLLVIPAFFGTLLFSREILGLVFGQEYTIAGVVLIILMGDKIFQAIQVIIGRSLQAINRPELAARATLVSLATNVVLNIILVWKFGIVGAAVATVTASLVNDFLHIFYLSRFISLQFYWGRIGWCILSSVVMFTILLIIKNIILIDDLITLAGTITLAVIVYGILVMAYPPIRIQTKQQLGNALF